VDPTGLHPSPLKKKRYSLPHKNRALNEDHANEAIESKKPENNKNEF
jgi:hypothetical protein